MIFVDSRTGSKEIAPLINDAVLTQLDYGDIYFEGNGPKGKKEIGVERKRVGDMVQSVQTGRLTGHQLPGLLDAYDRVYLIVEGQWQANRKTGIIEVFRHGKYKPLGGSRFLSKRLWGYLVSVQALTGVSVLITSHVLETARLVEELFHWWSQPWEIHVNKLLSTKATPPSAYLFHRKPSLIRRIAMELPGIDTKSIAVEKKFCSVSRMMEAGVEEWMEIEGIGKLTARNVWRALHE